MKRFSFWLARITTILFGLAMMALVLPYLVTTSIAWHADATRFYVTQQDGSVLLLHGTYLLQIIGALLFGLAGYLLILDHCYRTTLMMTFTLCVLVTHGLLNGGWLPLFLPAMFFACLGLLSFILARWADVSQPVRSARREAASSGVSGSGSFVI